MADTVMPQKRVIVVGGGFAGTASARHLRRLLPNHYAIELVSERNYFVFQPLLPEVVAGTINAVDAVTPLRQMLPGVDVRMGEVRSVDFEAGTLEIIQGSRHVPITRSFDEIVIATGLQTRTDLVPGLKQHGFCVRDLRDAHQLRNHLLQCLEHADVTQNLELKRQLLTFVVAGGGFSGVEVVGEIQEMLSRAVRFYPNLGMDDIRLELLHRGKQVLPELSSSLGAHAATRLAKRNVNIRFGTSLSRASASAIFTDNGERIATRTLITTIGAEATSFAQSLQVPMQGGRIVVQPTLEIESARNAWAVGDAACVRFEDSIAPTTAQFAVREAECLANNVAAKVRGANPQPFAYQPRGSMASIGHYDAVAEVFGRRFAGLAAWLVWRGFYLGMVPGFSTKLRIALNWMFDYLLPRSTVQISAPPLPQLEEIHCSRGDLLFGPGQIIDGLYTVVEGALESRIPDGRGADSVRVIGEGEHWGERSLASGRQTLGTLTALEDSKLLLLRHDAFSQLERSLPFFQGYFATIPQQIYPRGLRDDTARDER